MIELAEVAGAGSSFLLIQAAGDKVNLWNFKKNNYDTKQYLDRFPDAGPS